MFLSPVLTNIKSCHTLSRSLTPMGHEHSTQLHIFGYLIKSVDSMRFEQFCDMFPVLQTSVVLRFNSWVAKPSIHQHRVPSQCHHCFCQRVFRSEVCAVIQQDHLLGGKQKQIDHNPARTFTRNPVSTPSCVFFGPFFLGESAGIAGIAWTPCPGLAGDRGAREDTPSFWVKWWTVTMVKIIRIL